MSKTAIEELALRAVDAPQVYGLTVYTVWDEYRHTYLPIVKAYLLQGKDTYDRNGVLERMRKVGERFERGEIGLGYYRNLSNH